MCHLSLMSVANIVSVEGMIGIEVKLQVAKACLNAKGVEGGGKRPPSRCA